MHDLRRNDYDVTNSVQVSSTAAVTVAVRAGTPINTTIRADDTN